MTQIPHQFFVHDGMTEIALTEDIYENWDEIIRTQIRSFPVTLRNGWDHSESELTVDCFSSPR